MNKIAIVDDAQLMRRLLRSFIDGKKHQIYEADTGQGALDILNNEENITTLFLDLVMADMDGFQVLETINSPQFKKHILKKHPNLKIILMTSNDSHEIRNQAFRLGAAHFINKPFAKAEIQQILLSANAQSEKFIDATILIAEDSNLTRAIITSALKPFGIKIIEANDGDVAFEYLKEHPGEVDLIITDLIMERMNGNVLCQKIRTELKLRSLPIIFLTAVDDNSTTLDLFKVGATDYLLKPFIIEEFTSRIKVHIQSILLNKRLQKTINEQKELLTLKDEFLSVCSHDLRSPLTGILGFAEELHEQLSDQEHKQMTSQISTSGNYLLSLINDILDLGKSTASKSSEQFTQLKLPNIIAHCIKTLQASANKKHIQLKFNCPQRFKDLHINGEEVSLIRIFTNLISNSLKFTEKNGLVSLQLKQNGDNIEVTIKDNGIGIPEDKIPILFEKYTSASQEGTDGEKSTGLGMSIIKTLTEMHKGQISVFSKLGVGTIITLSFPLAQAPEQKQQTLNLDTKLEHDVSIAGKHILVVDDNPVNLSLLEKILSRSKAVVEAYSLPMEVITRYEEAQKTEPFDIVLMDLEMPEMSGFELTESLIELQDILKLPKTPIIALTAHQDDAIEQSVKDAGMLDILHKPINKIELIKKIHQYS